MIHVFCVQLIQYNYYAFSPHAVSIRKPCIHAMFLYTSTVNVCVSFYMHYLHCDKWLGKKELFLKVEVGKGVYKNKTNVNVYLTHKLS